MKEKRKEEKKEKRKFTRLWREEKIE